MNIDQSTKMLLEAIKAAMALLEVLEEDSAYGVLDAALKKYEENCND